MAFTYDTENAEGATAEGTPTLLFGPASSGSPTVPTTGQVWPRSN